MSGRWLGRPRWAWVVELAALGLAAAVASLRLRDDPTLAIIIVAGYAIGRLLLLGLIEMDRRDRGSGLIGAPARREPRS